MTVGFVRRMFSALLKREVIKNRKKGTAFRRLFGLCAAGLALGSSAHLLTAFTVVKLS